MISGNPFLSTGILVHDASDLILESIYNRLLRHIRPFPLHRIPTFDSPIGLFRVDGFGVEYSRRVCWGLDFGGVEEGGGEGLHELLTLM